jgi:(E)-4-hydroxy-3-methylbut-2-enyl-diphosphate synthase
VPVRIGVNAGSLSRDVLHKYGGPTPEALAASAWDEIRLFADRDYHEIKISLKSFSVLDTVAAYRLFSRQSDYPLHIGITEAGPFKRGAVRSAVGIGLLLAQGLGDTVRVSLTGDPAPEVGVAWEILRSLGLRERGLTLISCPTCARCRINLLPLVEEVEAALADVSAPLQVAVMGCEVNGPGEARQADVGVAGAGSGRGILFRKGKKIASFPAEQLVPRLLAEVQSLVDKKE